MVSEAELIEEYKEYLKNRVMANGFDFATWCQHQYGDILPNVKVTPNLQFRVIEGYNDYK
jgi:hypothetical protein